MSFNIKYQYQKNTLLLHTDQMKLALGWWSSTMGFSKNWKALGMVVVVLFPYLSVTVRGSVGTLSVRYSPVLQVISAPKCSLRRRGHNTNWLQELGSHKVTVQWKPPWQQSDSLLNPGFAALLARYFFTLPLPKMSPWTEFDRTLLVTKVKANGRREKKNQLMTPKFRSIPFLLQKCENKNKINFSALKCAYDTMSE